VEIDRSEPETISSIDEVAMKNEDHTDMLNDILTGLQSEEEKDVLIAISKLDNIQEVNAAIMNKLEALSLEDHNPDIYTKVQAALTRLKSLNISGEVSPLEVDSQNPQDVLRSILDGLKDDHLKVRLQATATLETVNYSSEAIRSQLEKLAVSDPNIQMREAALAALDLSTQRNVRRTLNKLEHGNRSTLLQEISSWEKLGLLPRQNAEVIRRRYDFDVTPQPALPPVSVSTATSQSSAEPTGTKQEPSIPTPLPQQTPQGPAPTLLQTLLSETSIKIALYLGALFVIASALILGVLSEGARLPVLIASTLIFGGLAAGIRKRLPQPSFTLFIVFSFLLPSTAGVVENSLNLSTPLSAGYWFLVSVLMGGIWAAGTWLYESRLFSITAFFSLLAALLRIGDIFNFEFEFHVAMAGLTVWVGLAGTQMIRKWKDTDFALPLFISAQLVQGIALAASITIFFFHLFEYSPPLIWNLATVVTWGAASLFFVISNLIFPFVGFPLLAAAALLPIPWFMGAAFDLSVTGNTILLFIWTALLAAGGEAAYHIEKIRSYSLPLVLASVLSAVLTAGAGFIDSTTTLFLSTLGLATLYSLLQIIRARGWLWMFALSNLVIAYFAFLNFLLIKVQDIAFSYELIVPAIFFLVPDLLLWREPKYSSNWSLPLRIFGAFFTLLASASFITDSSKIAAVGFGIFAVFFALYTLAKQKPMYGYLAAAYLPLATFFTLDALNIDAWVPALTTISVLYFGAGTLLRTKPNWSVMLRNSALALGTIISFSALITGKETGGWYTLLIGLLFALEMYISRDGWFEIGLPVFFTLGALLSLQDFDADKVSIYLLAFSLVWLIADLLAHLTFAAPRVMKWPIRTMGGLFTMVNYGYLFFSGDSSLATIGFAVYTLLFLAISLLYKQPYILYTFTFTLPLFVTFLFREFGFTKWIHPLIFIAAAYYIIGFIVRYAKREQGRGQTLLFSGLGLGTFVSLASPILGGLDAVIPVALAATVWAIEAFARKDAWFAFPANILYFLAWCIILVELDQDQIQFFTVAAGLLGLFQHYLLIRAKNKTGAFITGMVSQLILLGATYIQMLSTQQFGYFVILFFQFLAVLAYGVVIRSRSLIFTPIAIMILGLVTVLYSQFKGFGTVTLVGCTGIIMLIFGIIAVLMRERITKLGERLSAWEA
jgi:hypothetical protein